MIQGIGVGKQSNKSIDEIVYNNSLPFIQDDDIPHSIFEIEGSRECAIEFRSFSKNAGFTGTRCAFTVVPKSLKGTTEKDTPRSLHLYGA